jgi:hypothetical protein
MTGVIQGGWEFVIAAYAVSAGALLAYGASLFLRWRAEERRSRRAVHGR